MRLEFTDAPLLGDRSYKRAYASNSDFTKDASTTEEMLAVRHGFISILSCLLITSERADSVFRFAQNSDITCMYCNAVGVGSPELHINGQLDLGETAGSRNIRVDVSDTSVWLYIGDTSHERRIFPMGGKQVNKTDMDDDRFERFLKQINAFDPDNLSCNPYISVLENVLDQTIENPYEEIGFDAVKVIKDYGASLNDDNAINDEAENLTNIRTDVERIEKRFNPNLDTDMELIVGVSDPAFNVEALVNEASSFIETSYTSFVFKNNILGAPPLPDGNFSLFIEAIPKNSIHKQLPEDDYEAACRATGLYASTMKSVQDLLVKESILSNQQDWGVLRFQDQGLTEKMRDIAIKYKPEAIRAKNHRPIAFRGKQLVSYVLNCIDSINGHEYHWQIKTSNSEELASRLEDLTSLVEDTRARMKDVHALQSNIDKKLYEDASSVAATIQSNIDKQKSALSTLKFFNIKEKRAAKYTLLDLNDDLSFIQKNMREDGDREDLISKLDKIDPSNTRKRSICYNAHRKELSNLYSRLSEISKNASQQKREGEASLNALKSLLKIHSTNV